MRAGSPQYHQIADELRDQIVTGELAAGSQLPGEHELAERHQVSRNTIRLALRRLIDEGLLVSGQGRGTFVREMYEPVIWDWSTIEKLSQHMAAYPTSDRDQWATAAASTGRQPRQDVTVSIVRPSTPIAERLGLSAETGKVVLRHRIRYLDLEPYVIADSYIPYELAKETALMEPRDVAEPGGVLAAAGYRTARFRDEIFVRMPARAESDQLNLPAATPVAEHIRTGYDKDGTALRVMVSILPGDRNVLSYEVPAE